MGFENIGRTLIQNPPASDLFGGDDLSNFMFPMDPLLQWMETRTESPHFVDQTTEYDSQSLEFLDTSDHQFLAETNNPISDFAPLLPTEMHTKSEGTPNWETIQRSPRYLQTRDIRTPSKLQKAQTETFTRLPGTPNNTPRTIVIPPRKHQRLVQRSHSYQQARARSQSVDSLKSIRGQQNSSPANADRSVSSSPQAIVAIEEDIASPAPNEDTPRIPIVKITPEPEIAPASSPPIQNTPSKPIVEMDVEPEKTTTSMPSCRCLSATISSLESLYAFSSETMGPLDEIALLHTIRSALTACDQIITCRCGKKCWAGVRIFLVLQEVYSHLELLWSSASSNRNEVRRETMRGVMLLAGLELLQFPQTSRGEGKCLDWKDVVLNLSIKLKKLLADNSYA